MGTSSDVSTSSKLADLTTIIMVVLMAIGANLPSSMVVAFDKRFLLAGLIAIVAVSLVRYLKFTLVLAVAILAVGANIPHQLADELGMDKNIMLFALVAMVIVSLTNHVFKLPAGGAKKSSKTAKSNAHGAGALFTAIGKGRLSTVRALLDQGVNPNISTKDGVTPLIYAAAKGYGDVIPLLVERGADVNVKDKQGHSALSIARSKGFTRAEEVLKASGASG
ncbi:MAG: hypothetical protein BMS9Abin36_1155 [Gammaproteobacteria bacterium]|nr:MAG: hypothetical protein BMS9Abin36_1155 [Gammaproteobacteria bacterium]